MCLAHVLRLADMPSYDLNVKNGKVANGAAVIIWENRQPLAHNVWTSPAAWQCRRIGKETMGVLFDLVKKKMTLVYLVVLSSTRAICLP